MHITKTDRVHLMEYSNVWFQWINELIQNYRTTERMDRWNEGRSKLLEIPFLQLDQTLII